MFKKDDYWAVWLGFALIIVGMLIYLPKPQEQMSLEIDNVRVE